MKNKLLSRLLAVVLAGLFSQFVAADHHGGAANHGANATVAGILAEMNHFPSDTQKQQLMAIAEDEENSEAIRAVARATANIQHSATAADKEALNEIVSSDSASMEEKKLAEVIVNLNHSASPAAKEQLASLM